MIFASFSTVTAVFENLISGCMDNFGWSRRKAAALNCLALLPASLPAVFGYNIWKGVRLIRGMDILDTEDFLVSSLLLPLGSLIFLLFCVSRRGWGAESYLAEANTGSGWGIPPRLKRYFQFVLPVLILLILAEGLL